MKKILLSSFIILFCFAAFGQDIHFSQYNNTPLMTNPALTGAFGADHRIIANFRTQWRNITNSYMTYGLSYDLGFLKKKLNKSFLALGLQFFNDQSGDIKLGQTLVEISAAYHLTVNAHNVLAAGMQGGWCQRRLIVGNMIFGNQYDPNYSDGFNPSKSSGENMPFVNIDYGDFSAGVLWSFNSKKSTVTNSETKKVSAGLAIFHFNRPKQTFSHLLNDKLYMKIAAHVNSFIGFKNSKFSIQPSAVCFFQGPTHDIIVGTMFGLRLNNISFYTNYSPETSIAIGAHYRVGDAVIVMAQFDWKNFLIGLSYDINISKLTTVSNGGGGFEVSLRFMAPVANAGNKNLY